jgi:hypothetical protein
MNKTNRKIIGGFCLAAGIVIVYGAIHLLGPKSSKTVEGTYNGQYHVEVYATDHQTRTRIEDRFRNSIECTKTASGSGYFYTINGHVPNKKSEITKYLNADSLDVVCQSMLGE